MFQPVQPVTNCDQFLFLPMISQFMISSRSLRESNIFGILFKVPIWNLKNYRPFFTNNALEVQNWHLQFSNFVFVNSNMIRSKNKDPTSIWEMGSLFHRRSFICFSLSWSFQIL